jgi:peptide deformylase
MFGDPVLRRKSKKVHRIDQSIRQLIDDMIETVRDAHGSGLVAPQVGVPLRIILTSVEDKLHVVINPEIVDQSEEIVEAEEGCLSIPGWWGPVKRRERVTVRGLSRTGKPIKVKSEGWEARAFQHEVDHIDGIIFTDRLTSLETLRRIEEVDPAEVEAELEAVGV